MSEDERTSSPVAIVTGAGSGVGREAAIQLSALGWRVALVARTRSALEETAEACVGADECLVLEADLSDPGAPGQVVHDVVDAWGRIDALVNNAGMASLVPISDVTHDSLTESFAINAVAPGLLIAAVFPIMKTQRGGRIVNIASKGISDPFPGFFAYAAAKCALDSFTRSVENEGKRDGVRAFTVAPGAIETPMLRRIWDEKALPSNSTLNPADVARLVVECAAGDHDDRAGETIFLTP